MKKTLLFIPLLSTIIFLLYFKITTEINNLSSSDSLYFEEKYFRFFSNNYDNIKPGDFWTLFTEEKGIGFKASKNFGSAIILKDWSMYGFKLTKIIFRPFCTVQLEEDPTNCDAEMWLYHTKDNSYYPPGRRIYLPENYFVIIVPFKKTANENPSIDMIFEFLNLAKFNKTLYENKKKELIEVTPKKSVKLFQIIQNQPSYMFETELPITNQSCLFMVFTKYHFISNKDFNTLNQINNKLFGEINNKEDFYIKNIKNFYRNWRNVEDLKPSASLMMYNNSCYLRNIFISLIFYLLLF